MSMTRFNVSFIALLFASSAIAAVATHATGALSSADNPAPDVATAQQKVNALSVPFVPNAGQWDQRAAFKANTLGGAVFVTMEGALVYSFPGKALDSSLSNESAKRGMRHIAAERGPGWALSETLIDGKGVPRRLKPAGLGPNEAKVSYFTADNSADNDHPINTYNRVQLGQVYPGVNLQLRATGNNMEKIFTVAPGHSPKQIRLKLDGADRLEVNADGQLVAHTGNGPISFTAPIAFQEDASGQRESVSVAYALDADHARYGFTLGGYDASRPLIIDPLLQSTYLGGSGDESARALSVHPVSGEVIVAGYTDSTNLPGTSGGAQPVNGGGGSKAFVSRFNASLTLLLQSSYLGGSGFDQATAITVHPVSGEVIVAGYTSSTNLPGTTGGAQAAHGSGYYVAFVSRFNASLSSLLQSSYLGGSGGATAYAVTVHPASGELIVAGAAGADLPGSAGGGQPGFGGTSDAFVSRFNASLTTLLQSTYFGGSGYDRAFTVIVHPVSGEVIVAGETYSTDLLGTAGGAQASSGGGNETFVSRFNANLTTLLQSTYFGGSGYELASAVAVHPASGEVILAGITNSTNLPGTTGGAQATYGGGSYDGFVSRFNASLTRLLQSTYLGGSGQDVLTAMTVHPVTGEVIVAGNTTSPDLPGTAGGAQATPGGVTDAFVSRLTASLTARLQSTYLGGSGDDDATAVTVHPVSGEVIVAGLTVSTNFPGAAGGAQATIGSTTGPADAFISRLTADLSALLCNVDINGDSAVTPDKDGVLLLRYALGLRGATLIAGVPLGAARANAAAVESFIGSSAQYQVFGQPSAPAKAMQDGLVLLRLMQGIGDSTLLTGITPPPGATFMMGSTVRANVNARCGTGY